MIYCPSRFEAVSGFPVANRHAPRKDANAEWPSPPACVEFPRSRGDSDEDGCHVCGQRLMNHILNTGRFTAHFKANPIQHSRTPYTKVLREKPLSACHSGDLTFTFQSVVQEMIRLTQKWQGF